MKLFKILATAASLASIFVLAAPQLKADGWDKKTLVTFSEPVEVPGVGVHLLPAGTYMFKLVNDSGDRHIVQIFSADGLHVFTTILAIPNYRLSATDKTVITFRERPAGQPEALKAWFYPGSTIGQEFVYGKSRAIALAKQSNEPVLSTPVELDTANAEVLNTAQVETVNASGDTMQSADVAQAAPVPPQTEVAAAALPTTASKLPLIGLFGVVMLGGGFAARALLKPTV
jgi:hypothetical protein